MLPVASPTAPRSRVRAPRLHPIGRRFDDLHRICAQERGRLGRHLGDHPLTRQGVPDEDHPSVLGPGHAAPAGGDGSCHQLHHHGTGLSRSAGDTVSRSRSPAEQRTRRRAPWRSKKRSTRQGPCGGYDPMPCPSTSRRRSSTPPSGPRRAGTRRTGGSSWSMTPMSSPESAPCSATQSTSSGRPSTPTGWRLRRRIPRPTRTCSG